jgi:hypothetical protein
LHNDPIIRAHGDLRQVIMRKPNRLVGKFLRQQATRQFVFALQHSLVTALQYETCNAARTDSCSKLKRRPNMVRISRSTVFAAAIASALAAFSPGTSARADEALNNLGPVGPREPILVTIGNQRVIAFYVPERGGCAVNAVTWKDAAADAPYASTRVRVSLKPGQMFQLDGAQRQSISLFCGADASTLAVAAPVELILTRTRSN